MTPQQQLNARTFAALPVGATFQILARRSYRLIERYTKMSPDSVRSITDHRQWRIIETEIPGSHIALVPDGSYSAVPFMVE